MSPVSLIYCSGQLPASEPPAIANGPAGKFRQVDDHQLPALSKPAVWNPPAYSAIGADSVKLASEPRQN
ncbi:hypothetical protein HPP92_028850 [Vanilla planifolia]|uniref:Uncharacterized protein n=1 Tax=Vanilla planifolia TaxID=51239 RepID=A0A835U2Z0_VANPL|nr:hypothetical protein HPP92_028850 [Vanilla planifolia]KAG0446422.1 hypothetical protein HPP92_028839 [Vanilla planifolia]